MTLTTIKKAGLDEIALDHVFTIGASGNNHYTFQGEGLNGTVNDPTLYLARGKTYRFENGSGGHPIRIQSTSGASGTAYNTGVTNNASAGTVIVEVQHDAPDVLYYQCTSHANMNGVLYITGALADDGVTTAKLADDAVTNAKVAPDAIGNVEIANNAVTNLKIGSNSISTVKIQDDAVTEDKLANSINAAIAANTAKTSNATHTGEVTGSTSLTIANDAVTNGKIVDGAVTTTKIADDAVTSAKIADGTIVNADISSGAAIQGGKIAEMISGNTNNRVITATGSTNSFQAESGLIYDGSTGRLGINASSGADARLSVVDDSSTGGFNVKHSNLSAGIAIGYNTISAVGTNTNNGLNISTKGTSSALNCQIGGNHVFGATSDSRDFRIFKNANGWSTLQMDADGGITGPLRRHVRRMNNGQNSVATINIFRLRRYNWGSGFFEVRMYATYYSGSYLRRFRINGHGAHGNHYSVATMDDDFTNGGGADWGVGCQVTSGGNSAPGDNTVYYTDVQITIPNYWYGLCELVMSGGYQTDNADDGGSMATNSYTLWS